MSSQANRAGLVVLAICTLSGCQSGPRWAWWKHDTTPENASLVARSAPALPSTQSVPQSATVAATPAITPSANSIVGALPPSANSLAAAGIGPASITIPTTSPTTIAGASGSMIPTASPIAPTAYPGIAPASPIATAAAIPAATVASTPAGAAGPYDPNGYRPASATSAAAAPTSISPPETDRYGVISPSAGSEPDRYTMVPDAPLTTGAPPNANMASGDHYATAATAASAPATSPAAAPTTPISSSGESDRYAAAASANTSQPIAPSSSPPATPSTAATVRISAPAGQYRPGGTTTYTGLPASGVEIASRPTNGSPIATPPAAMSPTGMPSAPSSMPYTMPGSDAGIKTY